MWGHTLQARINVINNFPIESVMNETFSVLSFVNLISGLAYFFLQNIGIHFELLEIIDDFILCVLYHLILRHKSSE